MLQSIRDRDGRAGLAGTQYLTPDERRAEGKALRQQTPRQNQAQWHPSEGRRDPVELLNDSNEGRLQRLVPIRFGRMMQSPFAFYRGAAARMAADPAATPKSALTVQACGDGSERDVRRRGRQIWSGICLSKRE
jgi:hypothetical protein